MEQDYLLKEWSGRISANIKDAKLFLWHSCRFDSPVQIAEFWRQLSAENFTDENNPSKSDVLAFSVYCAAEGMFGLTKTPEIHLGAHYLKKEHHLNYTLNDVEKFLMQFGTRWIDYARYTNDITYKIRKTAHVIRRDILYPEVAGMEAKVSGLEKELAAEKVKSAQGNFGTPAQQDPGEAFVAAQTIMLLENTIERAITELWHTKGILGRLHSKTLGRIRETLMAVLPEERREKLCRMLGISCFRGKMLPPEPWPEPPPPPPKRMIREDVFSRTTPEPWPEPKDCSLPGENNSPLPEDEKPHPPQPVRICGLIDGRSIIIK